MPCRCFRRKIRLVGKFPGKCLSVMFFCDLLCGLIKRKQIIGKIKHRVAPFRRSSKRGTGNNSAFSQHFRTLFRFSKFKLPTPRLYTSPVKSISNYAEARTTNKFAINVKRLSRIPFIPFFRNSEDGLSSIHGEKTFRIRFPLRRVRNDGKTHRLSKIP